MTVHSIKNDKKAKHKQCSNCGRKHKYRDCPAYNSECSYCGNMGHWKEFCRKLKRDDQENQSTLKKQPRFTQKSRRIHAVDQPLENESSEDEDAYTSNTPRSRFHTVSLSDKCFDAITSDTAFTDLDIKLPQKPGQYTLQVKIDTGANANALPLRTFRQMYPKQNVNDIVHRATDAKLTSYSGDNIKCIGTMNIDCKYQTSAWNDTKFYVVDVPGPVILGLPACEKLGLVAITCQRVEVHQIDAASPINDLKKKYPEQFDRIGQFKDPAYIQVRPDAIPHIDRPRKCNINLLPQIKEELKQMEKTGVIRRVKEHTDWCSSIVYSTKKDGSIRICLDPKHLNNAIKRCPHKIPTLEEINPKFQGAKIFSKLDAKAGYWSVPIAEECQLLTTFRTPVGRYCFTRLPFGLNISQDIFQQRMDEILEDLNGCASIADDICVFGATEEEHNRNLSALMEAAKRHGLVFNSEKCKIRAKSISFFGNIYSEDGIRPDPTKVNDIHKMPTPQSKEDLQRFLGLMTYMGSFIPNLSTLAAPLRDLLKKDAAFIWEEDHEETFQRVKASITERSIAYYDANKPLELEVDASMKGLGACLVQDGRPIAHASKTLTLTEANYSNIEREMLAVVHGVERFSTYLYGRSFTIVSDHQPLEIICRKPLTAATPRLQRLLLKIQGYDFTVKYRPGEQMVISDSLSRLPNPEDAEPISLDIRVDSIELDLISFTAEKQAQLRAETRKCPTLNMLSEIIYQGWPDTIQELPSAIRSFWSFRDTLGIEDGILFKGFQVIIPESMRRDILNQLHVGHQGIEKTKMWARDCVYWPKINDDITRLIQHCQACQENQAANRKEPLQQTEIPSGPWKMLGTDIFEAKGKQYVILSDYFSKYPLIREIIAPVTSAAVTRFIEEAVSLFGVPEQIRSDNGPQYSGESFKRFCKEYGISHITSSPHYPQSNGFIERQIGWLKPIIKKCMKSGQNINMALMNIRATPVSNNIPSPAELLMKRKITTLLPSRSEMDYDPIKQQMQNKKHQQMLQYNKTAAPNDLPPLYPGQDVRVFDKTSKTWSPATVITRCPEPRSYTVQTNNGTTVRRNRVHLRECPEENKIEQERQPLESYTRELPPPRTHEQHTSAMTPLSNQRQHQQDTIPVCDNHNSPARNGQTTTRSGRVIRKPQRYSE